MPVHRVSLAPVQKRQRTAELGVLKKASDVAMENFFVSVVHPRNLSVFR